MASINKSTIHGELSPLRMSNLPPDILMMRASLKSLLGQNIDRRKLGSCKWGIYAFFDFDGEPIYVGQTRESLSTRINRHLQNQRTDSVAMRILDPHEVAEVWAWPLWELEEEARKRPDDTKEQTQVRKDAAQIKLNAAEYTAYAAAVRGSQFQATLNEKIPSDVFGVYELPEPQKQVLYQGTILEEKRHPDIRIARRAESMSRLADVARERGSVSNGLRRVLVVQSLRLVNMTADQLAKVEGDSSPRMDALDTSTLIGKMIPSDTTEDEPNSQGQDF